MRLNAKLRTALAILACLLAATIAFAFALAGTAALTGAQALPSIHPGFILPQTAWFGPTTIRIGDQEFAADPMASFVCATLQGQRPMYYILELGKLEQERKLLYYGVTSGSASISKRATTASSKLPTDNAIAGHFYVRDLEGVSTLFLNTWFKSYNRMLRSPLWVFAVACPAVLVLFCSMAGTRWLLDGQHLGRGAWLEPALLVFLYIAAIGLLPPWIAPPEATAKSTSHDFGATQALLTQVRYQPRSMWLESMAPLAICAFGARLWRRPAQTLVARIGVFAVIATTCTLVIESVLAIALLASGTVDLRSHFADAKTYAEAMYEATMLAELGLDTQIQRSPLAAIPTWDQACPPWQRFEVRRP